MALLVLDDRVDEVVDMFEQQEHEDAVEPAEVLENVRAKKDFVVFTFNKF